MSNEGEVLAYAIFGLIFGIILFFSGFKRFKEKKLIENTPTSKIRSLAMGLVEVYGKVIPRPKEVILAPFSGDKCVYCRYLVEEFRQSGKHSRWVKVQDGVLGGLFYLEDDTGRVLVDAKGAEVCVPQSFIFNPKTTLLKPTHEVPERIKKYLDSSNMKLKLGTQRFKEFSIFPDEKLYIMGTADDNPFVEEATAQKNEADIMIQKGKSFYYISDKPEKEVLKDYNWKVIGALFGGAALILGCLFVIFSYIQMRFNINIF